MRTKKIPMRKCMGCMEMFPKKELIRVVKTKNDDETFDVSIDLTGKKNGRGAYICRSGECLQKARKAKRIERALDCSIEPEVWERLAAELEQ